jgi:hypothetical protein
LDTADGLSTCAFYRCGVCPICSSDGGERRKRGDAALDEADLVEELGVKKMHAKRLLQLVRGAAETGPGKVEREQVQVQAPEREPGTAAAAPEQKQKQEQGGGKAGEEALTASMLYPPGYKAT